jgi:GT2 family glycosyltransferase
VAVDNSPVFHPVRPLSSWMFYREINAYLLEGQEGDDFSTGFNRGLNWLTSRGWNSWVWLLNPDVTLKDSNTLAKLKTVRQELPGRMIFGTAVINNERESWSNRPAALVQASTSGAGH